MSIEDIASSVTGLSLSRGATERGSVFSRGFSIYYTQDGLPMSSSADTLGFATLAMYDRVEVLRGAAGMMTGVGNPSGTLNLARKRPTRDRQVSVEGSIGRWDNYRAQVDAGGPLNEAGTLRGRAVAAYNDSHTFLPDYGHQRGLVYGTLEADLTPDTTVSVAFHKNSEKNPGSSWYGLGTQANGTFYPGRELTTAPAWTYWNKENTRLFGEVEQRLPKGWKVRLAAQALNDKLDSVVNGFDRASPGSYNLNLISANVFQYDRDQRAVDLSAAGPFELLGRRHEVVAGLTYRSLDQDDLGWRAATPPGYSYVFDPVNWNPADAPRPDISQFYYGQNTETEQGSAYTTARFVVLPELAVLAGARWDTFKYDSVNVVTGASTASYQVEGSASPASPRAGPPWRSRPGGLDLRAAITNVFDRDYYQSIGTPTGSNSLGEPRSVQVTARYTFQ